MATDFKKQDIEGLHASVAEMRESLRVLRFEGAGSRTRNVRSIRNTRRDIARALTELRVKAVDSGAKKA